MKKLYTFLLAGLLFGGSAIAQPYNVTFQVDMTGQTVDPNGPHIAGNFQAAAGFPGDWDPAATSLTLVSCNDRHQRACRQALCRIKPV